MNPQSPARDLTLPQQISLLAGRDFWRTADVPGLTSVHLADGPHGLRVQGDEVDHLGLASSQASTCFPPAVTLASSWDSDLVESVGAAVGREARALGVGLVLGPGLNIKRHPLCGRNFEYFSEDPLVSGVMAEGLVSGLQSTGVGACLKHFAVNNQEAHRFVVDAVVDERTLRELYLQGFEYAVTASHPAAVMAAYNLVNGVPATEHRHLLTEVLRDEWGFDGLVVSDWGATCDRVAGVLAGMDLEMPGGGGLNDGILRSAVAAGDLPPAAVATCADRVAALGEHVETTPSGEDVSDLAGPHDELARAAAAAGTVLLTNDGTLPLDSPSSIALIGGFADAPRHQGGGSSLVTPTRLTTAREALAERGLDVTYAPGYDTAGDVVDPALQDEAVAAAASADVAVVVVGLPESKESEGWDREDLALPAAHDALVEAVCAANPRTVVALSNGAPVTLPWRDEPAAILEAYLGGQAGGGALVDVLFGDAEPGGRLAESFPAERSDVAADPYFPGEPHQVEYREGLFVGYRHHCTGGPAPAFPFGHGLGYTTTEWDAARVAAAEPSPGSPGPSDPHVVAATVDLTVRNTGDRDGSDVVQVYLRRPDDPVLRPERWLAGFAKVRVAAGTHADSRVGLPLRAFSVWDPVAHEWRVVAGRYEVLVARSSTDVVETLELSIDHPAGDPDAEIPEAEGTAAAPGDVGALDPDAPPVAATDEEFTRRLGRPIPEPRPVRPFTRDSTVGELAGTRLGAVVRSLIYRASPVDIDGESEDASSLLFERSIEEMPLRAAASFSQGALPWRAVDALLAVLNLRPPFGRSGRR